MTEDTTKKNNATPSPSSEEDAVDFDLTDEIVVKDKDGSFKVIIGGKIAADKEEGKKDEPPLTSEESKELISKEKASAQITPLPPAIPQDQGTAFFFDVEDEEEVKKIAAEKKLPPDSFDAGKAAAEIVKQSGLQLSAEKYKRVVDILVSRLKQIREKHDTLAKLTDTTSGAGLDSSQAQKLVDLAEQFLNKREKGDGASLPSTSELDRIIAQEEDTYQIQSEIKQTEASPKPASYQEAIAEDLAVSKPELVKEPQFSPPPQPEPPPSLPVDSLSTTKKEEGDEEGGIKQVESDTSLPPRRKVSQSSKPRLEDVKIKRRLLGPIDELKYLTLDELRRWGGGATERIAKIKQKIDALEDESFAKKIEGIKAWRSSPLYQLYLQIGKDSMEQGKPIRDIIAARQSQGQETLSWEEFTLISDLNQQLRF